MSRDFFDPGVEDDIFERQEAVERRARIEASAVENEKYLKYENEQAAIRKESARKLSLRANDTLMIAEYLAAGVKPVHVNGEGVPIVSLGLLRWQGWTIEEFGGQKTLVAPPLDKNKPRKRREDYDQSS